VFRDQKKVWETVTENSKIRHTRAGRGVNW